MFIKYSSIKQALLPFLILILLFFVFPISTEATTDLSSDRIVVSLGDSYSSGEGIEPFYGQYEAVEDKVKNEDWLAHRSKKSWSGMLKLAGIDGTMADNFDTHWFFAASSGATTKHLKNEQKKEYSKRTSLSGHYAKDSSVTGTGYISAQLEVFGELGERKADYVTLTLGGNDAGFEDIIKSAALGSTYLNLSGLSDKLEDTWKEFYKKDGIGDKLKQAYDIISSEAGSQAKIIVAGYPELLDSNGKGALISKEEATLINSAVSKFNKAISEIVSDCGDSGKNIYFVSVEEAFKGHGAYSQEPYINEIFFGTKAEDLKDLDYASAYSIHPNYAGACAYAECVQNKIDELEQESLFNNTCWIWGKGVTVGSRYAVLFHSEGMLSYYKMNEGILGTKTYEFENGILYIDDIAYVWDDGQFLSNEKFEVNGTNEPECFRIQPDLQKNFFEFVPTFENSEFSVAIEKKYGKISSSEFVSCVGSNIYEYPSSTNGFITETSIDLDNDGIAERIAVISKEESIYLQVYTERNGSYTLTYEKYITTLSYCKQQNFSIFYSPKKGEYILFVDKISTGAYTGVEVCSASLYVVKPTNVYLSCSINEMDFDTEIEDIPLKLSEFDVPFAQNCAHINNITSDSMCVELLEVRHRYHNVDPMGGWQDREHYLQIVVPEKLE